MRPPLIAGNWKMNGTAAEAEALARGIRAGLEARPPEGVEILVCPHYLVLERVRVVLEGSVVRLGAQDVHWELKGAFTGEISPSMLKDAGCTHVILGHSERRHIMGESNEQVNRKLKAALAHGLTPIVCVGELLEERTAGDTRKVVERQAQKAFEGVAAADAARTVLAYEPVWAIGTGKTASPAQAEETHRFLRNTMGRIAGAETAERIRILYGGSVKPENIRELMEQPDVDGALVGGASLDAASFLKIARYKE
ncbi:MAG TPA: triose-phosphate isomerase [Planctomycetota bacterium]|nr:triose-phosphate isomerase [Planctomycetota bacterium]